MNSAFLTLTKCAFALSVLLAACGGKGETELLDSAKAYLAKKDTKAAIIQLKTALQKSPESGETRYLLGKTMLETGDAGAAAVELQKAADLKYNIALVVPQLAKAWLEQGEYKKVIDQYAQFSLPDTSAQAELKTALATAYARLGSNELADTALQAAFASAPNHPSALLFKARMLADKKDFAQAQTVLDQVISGQPANPEAWLLKAEINHYGSNDRPAALAAYRKALEYKPDAVNAHKGLITVLEDSQKLVAVEKAKDPQWAQVEPMLAQQLSSSTAEVVRIEDQKKNDLNACPKTKY